MNKFIIWLIVSTIILTIGCFIYLLKINNDRSEWCEQHSYKSTDISNGKFSRTICIDDQRRMIWPE